MPTGRSRPRPVASWTARSLSLRTRSREKVGAKSPSTARGAIDRNRLLTVAAPESTTVSTNSPGSRPAACDSISASAVTALITLNIRLLTTFSVAAAPTSPTCTTRVATGARAAATASYAATGPPTGIVQEPTISGRPRIGVSR